jgi:hypothetical protein
MEASQHSLLAACFTLHSINATLAIVPQRGAGLWIVSRIKKRSEVRVLENRLLMRLFGPRREQSYRKLENVA